MYSKNNRLFKKGEINIMKKYILGVGTGRCGTMSLAKLLNGCGGVEVSHELGGEINKDDILPWNFERKFADLKLNKLLKLKNLLVGDVALYYLNYIDFFYKKLHELKIVYMWRDKQEVVKSYMKKTETLNHWWSTEKKKNTLYRIYHKWDTAYPDLDYTIIKPKAIEEYWEIYHKRAFDLKKKYKNKMMIIDIKNLNNHKIQKILFDFLEISENNRRYQSVIENKGRK